MTDPDRPVRVLVPVRVLKGESVPDPLVEFLSDVPVVLLGYHVVPEQTAPGQAQMQFEDRAETKLTQIADAFADAGGTVETRLVFTHDAEQTFDRVAAETDCAAVLVPNASGTIERVLVPLHPDVNVARLAAVVAGLVAADENVTVTLFRTVARDGADSDEAAETDDWFATARETLVDRGIAADRITEQTAATGRPIRATASVAAEHDLVVMGERSPSLHSFVFGEEADQIAEFSLGPVVMVRRPVVADGESDG